MLRDNVVLLLEDTDLELWLFYMVTYSSIWRDGCAYHLTATATVKVTAGDKE